MEPLSQFVMLPSGTLAYFIFKNCSPVAKETQMYRTVFWTLWERVRVGWFGSMALKHVNYHM